MSAIKYWLWLSSAGAGPKVKRIILDHYDGDPMAAFYAPTGEYSAIPGVAGSDVSDLERRDMDRALRILDDCDEQNIDIITLQDARYPNRLKAVYAPPTVIYVKGHMPPVDEEAAIAVIGTRKATPYGLKMGKLMGYEITKCGGLVLSGLTAGIDAAGAEGALRAGGRCIGVLGVPHEHEKSRLSQDVAAVGALISEYPPGTVPQNSFFRARNRITSGLSVGVVVVEAPERSGTRLFANEAADQGKELFAVPGNADADNAAGSNALLKEGATPVTEGWEIMSEFRGLFPEKVHKPDSKIPQEPPAKPKISSPDSASFVTVRQPVAKKVIDNEKTSVYIDLQTQLKNLSDEQLKIISAITEPSTHVDDVIERTGMTPAKVLAGLTMLQLCGYVKQETGKRFTLNIKTK